MSNLSVIGKRGIRVDAAEKVTGEAKYVTDLKLPRMLQGKILRSPHPHARILNIDTTRAERLPGVKAVVTARDAPPKKIPGAISDQYALATEKVRFIGDEVAAVAAIDEDIAEEALELINVDYEILPAVFDPLEAMKEGAPQIHDVEHNIARHMEISRGDIDLGFTEADHIIENTYKLQPVQHCSLDSISCIVSCDSSGNFTFWANSQDPYMNRSLIAAYMDIPVSSIRVIQPYIGGAFGGKIGPLLMPIGAVLAQKARYPVKIIKTRQEDFTTSFARVSVTIHLKIGAKDNGTITAKHLKVILDNGAYSHGAPHVLACMVVSRGDAVYRLKNLKSEGDLVYTNKIPSHAFRGFGNPQVTFAIESQLDMIAGKIGMDPLELRLKNATQKNDTTVHGWNIRSCGLSECLRKAAERAEWKEKRTEKRTSRGIGMASTSHPSGARAGFDFDGSSAFVKIDEDGKAQVISGEVDLGQGSQTVFAHITAEVLNIPLKNVSVSPFDSDRSPYATGTKATRVTHIGGNAVRLAALDARKQLLDIAAKRLETSASELDIKNARVFVKNSPEKSLSIADIVKSGLYSRGGALIVGKGMFDTDTAIPDTAGYGNVSSAYTFATHVAEVEVDVDTGQVKVLNYIAVHDVGKTINATLAEGQVHGAVAQGIGYALTEEMILENGRVLNDAFTDYKILTAMDVPSIDVMFVESNDPNGPFGAKGLGEPSINPVAGAIANAIYDAVGIRIKELPITPEKILKALREKQS